MTGQDGEWRRADLEDRAGDTGKAPGGDKGQDGKGDGNYAEVRDKERGRGGWSSTAGPGSGTPQAPSLPAAPCPHLLLPPGAGGFPFCCKQSVDVTETQ